MKKKCLHLGVKNATAVLLGMILLLIRPVAVVFAHAVSKYLEPHADEILGIFGKINKPLTARIPSEFCIRH